MIAGMRWASTAGVPADERAGRRHRLAVGVQSGVWSTRRHRGQEAIGRARLGAEPARCLRRRDGARGVRGADLDASGGTWSGTADQPRRSGQPRPLLMGRCQDRMEDDDVREAEPVDLPGVAAGSTDVRATRGCPVASAAIERCNRWYHQLAHRRLLAEYHATRAVQLGSADQPRPLVRRIAGPERLEAVPPRGVGGGPSSPSPGAVNLPNGRTGPVPSAMPPPKYGVSNVAPWVAGHD